MSAEYRNNHYVPQWYQRRFIPRESKDRELFLLDLKPEKLKTPSGKRLTRKALRRTGPRRCFASDDLYTTRIGGIESRELEKTFLEMSIGADSAQSNGLPKMDGMAFTKMYSKT
jgi:hypothetical protein